MRKAIMASSVAVCVGLGASVAFAQEAPPQPPVEEKRPVTVLVAAPADQSKPGVDEFAKTGELGTVIGESVNTAGPAQGAEGCRPGDRQGRWLAR